MIELICPTCGKHLGIDDKFRGQTGKCNGCGCPIHVPIANLPSEKQLVFDTMTATPPESAPIYVPRFFSAIGRRAQPDKTVHRRHIPWIVAGLCVAVYYLQPSLPQTPPMELAESGTAVYQSPEPAPSPTSTKLEYLPTPSRDRFTLNSYQAQAAQAAVMSYGFPAPSMRLNGGNIRAEVYLTNQPPLDVGEYAKKAVLAMRNSIYITDGADPQWIYKLTI